MITIEETLKFLAILRKKYDEEAYELITDNIGSEFEEPDSLRLSELRIRRKEVQNIIDVINGDLIFRGWSD